MDDEARREVTRCDFFELTTCGKPAEYMVDLAWTARTAPRCAIHLRMQATSWGFYDGGLEAAVTFLHRVRKLDGTPAEIEDVLGEPR